MGYRKFARRYAKKRVAHAKRMRNGTYAGQGLKWLWKNKGTIASLVGSVNAEKKYDDETYNVDLITNSSQYLSETTFNKVGQGVAHDEREGRSLKLKFISIRGAIYAKPAVTSQFVRLMAVRYKSYQTNTPNPVDILDGFQGNDPADVFCHYRKEADSIEVLWDEIIKVTPNEDFPTELHYINKTITFDSGVHVKYRDDGTTVEYGEIAFFCFCQNTTSATNNQITIELYPRVHYLDN